MQNKFLELVKKNNKKIILSFLSILLISFLIVKINGLFRLNKIEKQTFSQMPSEKQDDYLQLQDSLALLEPEKDYIEGQVIAKFDETYLDLDKRFSLDNLRKDLLLKNIKLELNNQFEKSNQVVLGSKTKSTKEIIDIIYFYPYIKRVSLDQVLETQLFFSAEQIIKNEQTNCLSSNAESFIKYSEYENYWNELLGSDSKFSGDEVKIGIADTTVEKFTWRKDTFSGQGEEFFFKNLSKFHFSSKTGDKIKTQQLPPDDYVNHGTSVAGVVEEISQRHNNQLKIVSLFREDRNFTTTGFLNSLQSAKNYGVEVFNLSFGFGRGKNGALIDFKPLEDYIKNSNSLYVWALSNDKENYGENSQFYSLCEKKEQISNLICVGSENNGKMTAFSSYTNNSDQNKNFIYAPGQEMYLPVTGYYCPFDDGECTEMQVKFHGKVDEGNFNEDKIKAVLKDYPATYCRRSGNSFAAPYIAGLAGLVMSQSNLDASATKALIFDNSKQTLAQKDENIFQFGSTTNEVPKKKVDFQAVLKAVQNEDEVEKTIDQEKRDEVSETSPSDNATQTEETSGSTDTTTPVESDNDVSNVFSKKEEITNDLIGQSCSAEEGKTYLDNIITKCSDNGRQALVCENGTWKIDRYCGADQACQEVKRWKMGFLGIGSHDEYHYVCAPKNLDCSGGFICDSSYYLDENNQKIPSNEVFRCDSGLGKSQKWNTWEKQPQKLSCSADKRCINEFDENYEPKSYSCKNFATLCLNSGGDWNDEQCDCSNNFSYDDLSKQCLPPDLKYRCTSFNNEFFLEEGKFYDGPILRDAESTNKNNYMYLWNKTEYGFFQSENLCQKSADCFNDQEKKEEYCHEMTKCLLGNGQWKDLFGQQKCFCNNQELQKKPNGFYELCVEGYGAVDEKQKLCKQTGGVWRDDQCDCENNATWKNDNNGCACDGGFFRLNQDDKSSVCVSDSDKKACLNTGGKFNNQGECECDSNKDLKTDGKNGCECSDGNKDYDDKQGKCVENTDSDDDGSDRGLDSDDGSGNTDDGSGNTDDVKNVNDPTSIPSLCINFDLRRGDLCVSDGYAFRGSACCSGDLNSSTYHSCDLNGNYSNQSNTLACKQAFCEAQNEGENNITSKEDCVDGNWADDNKKCTYENESERWEWKDGKCVDKQSKEVKEEKENKEKCESSGGDWDEAIRKCKRIDSEKLNKIKELCESTGGQLASWDESLCVCQNHARWKKCEGCQCYSDYTKQDNNICIKEENGDEENPTQEETTEDSLEVGKECDWEDSLKCNENQDRVLECKNGEITVQKACSEPNPVCLQQKILAICTSQKVADQINEEETVEIGEDCSWEYHRCNKDRDVVSCQDSKIVEAKKCDENSPCQSYYYAKTEKYLAGCGFGPLSGINYSCEDDECLEIGNWWYLFECEDEKIKDISSLYQIEEDCKKAINDESSSGNKQDDEDESDDDGEGNGGDDDESDGGNDGDDNKVDLGEECQKDDDCVDTALCINEICREKCGIGGNANKSSVRFSSGNTNGTSYNPDSAYFASNQVQVKGFSGRVKAPTNPSTKQPFSCSKANESCSYYLEVCLPNNSKEMCLAYNSAKDIDKDKVEKEKAEGKQGSRTYDNDKCVCNGDWQLTDRGECVAKPLFCSEKNKGTKLEEIWNATYQRCVNKGANLPDSKKDEEKIDCYFLDKENCSMKDKDGKEVPILQIANEMCALECKNFQPRDEDDVDSMNSQWGNVDQECYLHQRDFPKSISPKDSGRIINCNGFGKVGDSTLMSRCGAIFSGDCRNNYKPNQDTGACCEVK